MNIKVGEKALITTDDWFIAPDGQTYKAVHGTINAVLNDAEALGIKTNARSSNWFISIGNMLIAGCQIHYAIKCSSPDFEARPDAELSHDGVASEHQKWTTSRIFNADT